MDCTEEQGSDKSLGQSTDWEVTELEHLLETALEECQDDLEGLRDKKSKSKFTRIDQFKLNFKKPVTSQSDETKATTKDLDDFRPSKSGGLEDDLSADPYATMY